MIASQEKFTDQEFPLVVQVGFAGTRRLSAELEGKIGKKLAEEIANLRDVLGLRPRHFLCGISQLAIGADTLFTQACKSAGIPQRIFLPQHRDEFLNAIGSSGPDFNEQQKSTASTLLRSSHIIQERVVSDAADRRDRFHDVNLEIVRVCDLVICLVATESSGKSGGTHELIALAQKRQRPILELRVETVDGEPRLSSNWHGKEHFRLPTLPTAIDAGAIKPGDGTMPSDVSAYYGALKQLASNSAHRQRKYFTRAALVVIGAHLAATMIAVIALKVHIAWLLAVELLFLAAGYGMHRYIHQTHAVEKWALSRLIAEVARSVISIGRFHSYLDYLFSLPFPESIRPLLRTVSVLHLHNSRPNAAAAFENQMSEYVASRLTDPNRKAQIPHHESVVRRSGFWLFVARSTFLVASLGAFAATSLKLLVICHCLPLADTALLETLLGAFAILLPVVAVAALSLAAGFDQEARHHTSEEMLRFIQRQRKLLEAASSSREYNRLLLETESRLLGETVNWYARRSFLGIV